MTCNSTQVLIRKSRPNAVSIHGGGGLFVSALSRTNRSTREGKCLRAPHLQRLSIQTMSDKNQTVAFFILLSEMLPCYKGPFVSRKPNPVFEHNKHNKCLPYSLYLTWKLFLRDCWKYEVSFCQSISRALYIKRRLILKSTEINSTTRLERTVL